jgi:transcriptional regulator with XRE-family HTH domain
MMNVREWRELAGLSLHELGKELGLSPSRVSAIENGHRGITSEEEIKIRAACEQAFDRKLARLNALRSQTFSRSNLQGVV